MLKKLTLGILCAGLSAASLLAAAPAADNASNYTGTWDTTTNGGIGFGNWSFATGGTGTATHYIGGTGLGLSTFGLSADAGASSSTDRSFSGGSLLSGETFSFDLGYTSNVGAGATIGMNLLSGGTPVFTLQFTGGTALWQINDGGGGGNFDTTIPFTPSTPMSIAFTYNGGSSYNISITQGVNTYSPGSFTATNPINAVDGFRVFNNGQGAGENIGFDNLAVVPEPTSLSLLAGPALLGAWFVAKRRRS